MIVCAERRRTWSLRCTCTVGIFAALVLRRAGHDPVAEVLFGEINANAFFLEYDDARSGGFDPLRFVPKDKFVVLGVVSSKIAALESKEDIKRRIDSAAKGVAAGAIVSQPAMRVLVHRTWQRSQRR